MGLQLEDTGSVTENISNLIDALNSFDDSNITNALNVVAYGQFQVDVPPLTNEVTTGSFLHNLGYAPLFDVKVIDSSNANLDLPTIIQEYGYTGSGSQSQGAYPFCIINTICDEQNLKVTITNIGNSGGHFLSGIFTFSYLLFSRPIHG